MKPENFKDGDRVRHVSRDEIGTVKITGEGHVMVTFDNPTPRGHKSVGIYDYNWFDTYPNGLQQTPGAVLESALKSISKNTCCSNCREAALVARSALGSYVGLARTPKPGPEEMSNPFVIGSDLSLAYEKGWKDALYAASYEPEDNRFNETAALGMQIPGVTE